MNVDITLTSVGNTASLDTTGGAIVDSMQDNAGGNVSVELDAEFFGKKGSDDAEMNIDLTAVANTLTITHDGYVHADSIRTNGADVSAIAKIASHGTKDALNLTAIGNNFSVSRQVDEAINGEE